ncbi:peptidoglycan-binding protein [Alteribacillus sp. HJP-4]|uniref:peptidoglycan-binding protein n=1 Tax=Alteribacillus sp. HJP-4 TaxID=2775394 RepID=UPI0035CCD28F
MKLHQKVFSVKTLGVPAVAAGLVFFAGPVGTDASELGDTDLKSGHESSEVESLQELLNEKGLLDSSSISGSFSDETVSAVESYQDENGLSVDGIAGPNTLGALEILGEGDNGVLVENLQEKLDELGYYESSIDGIFGPKTDEAVTDFQSAEDIGVDGLAGPETFGALVSALNTPESDETEESEPVEESEPAEEEESSESSEEAEESSEQESTEAPEETEEAEETSTEESESTESSEDVATETSDSEEAEGESLQVEATAYTANCTGCSGVTATGVDLNANPDSNVIAVDPDVIPLGSTVEVEGHGTFTADDTGGAIQGNKIDIFMPSQSDAESFGRQTLDVTVVD